MNMYELFKAKQLPPEIQNQIETRIKMINDKEEKLFMAGFLVANRIKKIRKELGIED